MGVEQRVVLFSVNTYYQLIMAVKLRLTVYAGYDADLIISDHSTNAAFVCERIKQSKFFNNVFFVNTKVSSRFDRTKLRVFANAIFFSNLGAHSINSDGLRTHLSKARYDAFVFYNVTYYHVGLYSVLHKKNPNIRSYFMDEGVLSTLGAGVSLVSRGSAIALRLKNLKREMLADAQMYVCLPEVIDRNRFAYTPIVVPTVSAERLRDVIVSWFMPDDAEESAVSTDYIYFGQSFAADGCAVGERQVVKKIVDAIGSKNLTVKAHPRSTPNEFAELGVNVLQSSWIPWEVMCLRHGYANKVFISISSGSVINPGVLFECRARVVLLYNFALGDKWQSHNYSIDELNKFVATVNASGAMQLEAPANAQDLPMVLAGSPDKRDQSRCDRCTR